MFFLVEDSLVFNLNYQKKNLFILYKMNFLWCLGYYFSLKLKQISLRTLQIKFSLTLILMNPDLYSFNRKNQDIYLTPKKEKHTDTLVFLHGLGDTADGWVDLFLSEMNPCPQSTKIILLTAPIASVTANMGYKMPSWYDIKEWGAKDRDFDRTIGRDEVDSNAERIKAVLNHEIEILKGESRNVLIGGFSQGAAMSLHTGLGYQMPLGGILSWSGYLFPFTKISKENENVPVFISHGLDDNVVDYKMSETSFKRLDASKHQITKVIEKGLEHSVTDRIIR